MGFCYTSMRHSKGELQPYQCFILRLGLQVACWRRCSLHFHQRRIFAASTREENLVQIETCLGGQYGVGNPHLFQGALLIGFGIQFQEIKFCDRSSLYSKSFEEWERGQNGVYILFLKRTFTLKGQNKGPLLKSYGQLFVRKVFSMLQSSFKSLPLLS